MHCDVHTVAGCCYGNKVFLHRFSHFCKKVKKLTFHKANYWPSDRIFVKNYILDIKIKYFECICTRENT